VAQTPTAVPTPTLLPTPGPALTATTVLVSTPTPEPVPTVAPGSELYITFDGELSRTWTPPLLELLAAYGVRATFFVGERDVQQSGDLFQAVRDAGHTVALHPAAHQTLDSVGRTSFFASLGATATALPGGRCLRPPYSALNAYTRRRAEELGYAVVLWDVDAQRGQQLEVADVTARLLSQARPGTVIRFHDLGAGEDLTLSALKQALPVLAEQGYVFPVACR
jgi:peptidoglycan/xylan/chitin deacetylase (PgdA/CDA1 family)